MGRNSESLSKLDVGDYAAKAFDFFNILFGKFSMGVKFCVLRSIKDLEIFRTIVGFYAIDMVDDFSRAELPSKHLLNDVSMPPDEFTFSAKNQIAFVVGGSAVPAWVVCSSVLSCFAFFDSTASDGAAKIRSFLQSPARSMELLFTDRAVNISSGFLHCFKYKAILLEESIVGIT